MRSVVVVAFCEMREQRDTTPRGKTRGCFARNETTRGRRKKKQSEEEKQHQWTVLLLVLVRGNDDTATVDTLLSEEGVRGRETDESVLGVILGDDF